MAPVSIIGTYQSDFARTLKREGMEIADLVREVAEQTLVNANVDATQIETIHVGNAFGQLYTGQGHLGAMPATVIPELWGVPAMRHEAACASGSIAVLAASAEIEAGRYDCALVLGVEQEKTMPGSQAAQTQEAAAWVGHETGSDEPIWACMFDQVASEYDKRFGIDEVHLHAIGKLNLENARTNPNAQTRDWKLSPESFGLNDEVNPQVAGRLRRNDCCQITDGGAGVVLVSDRWLDKHRPQQPTARITGWGHQTVGLPMEQKLTRSNDGPYVMPHVRKAITDAFARAGIADVTALDPDESERRADRRWPSSWRHRHSHVGRRDRTSDGTRRRLSGRRRRACCDAQYRRKHCDHGEFRRRALVIPRHIQARTNASMSPEVGFV
jgi:acetyl-CoA C-acetyltransferase